MVLTQMGSVVEEQVWDVEETIFVAVGSDVKQSQTTLFWAVKNFVGKNICLLHVHSPSLCDEISSVKLRNPLDEYLLILTEAGVQANKVLVEMDSVEDGIVEMIARHDIRWLVMGAAADEYYTRRLAEIRSKKAIFVCQNAASSCHIWFVCKGHLIYTRGDNSEIESTPPLLLLNSAAGAEEEERLSTESVLWLRNLEMQRSADAEEDINDAEYLSWKLPSLLIDEEETEVGGGYDKVTQAVLDRQNSKQMEFEDTASRWKEEDDAMEAKCKAKAFESLCTKEMTQRKELEELLATVRQEAECVEDECDKLIEQVQTVRVKNLVVEGQLAESQCTVQELEEKIVSAVELLISFREKRDNMQVEHRNAIRKVKQLSTFGKVSSFCHAEFPMFSFMEINEATQNFDPSQKIGEGRYGSVYKGILRHMDVAIKMLPSYGSKSQLDFQNEVEVLSRVRHPNVVTLIGICPESRSLVYEYLKNGCLEDRLSGKDKAPPLPWQIRTCIATEICSALIFLHSNIPRIVHGNLKPSNILLDANFVSKLGDLGIVSLIQQNEDPANFTKVCNDPNGTSVYMDPDYLETGKLTQESDVYSFGIILLRLLTARPLLGIVNDVKCALENDSISSLLDVSAGDWPNDSISSLLDVSAGDWPVEQAKELALLAMRCCEKNRLNRIDLSVVHEVMRTSCDPSQSCSISKKLLRTPSHFVCPILQDVMTDPRIAADGYTYEEEAIQGWFKSGHNTSPMTNLELEHCNLVPNYAILYAIQQWKLQ